jgi:hypothetical protein
MNRIFRSPIAGELFDFLKFKRSLGYGYRRAEFALREFDKFLSGYNAEDFKQGAKTQAVSSVVSDQSAPGLKFRCAKPLEPPSSYVF